jgi:hypothetical protein
MTSSLAMKYFFPIPALTITNVPHALSRKHVNTLIYPMTATPYSISSITASAPLTTYPTTNSAQAPFVSAFN